MYMVEYNNCQYSHHCKPITEKAEYSKIKDCCKKQENLGNPGSECRG